MSKITGGPAFPVSEEQAKFPGMTLRDYFAAKAMTMLRPEWRIYIERDKDWDPEKKEKWCAEIIAKASYEIADAMLLEREKE